MKILYPLHVTGFNVMSDNDKKETEKEGKEMIFTIIYLESSHKAIFSVQKKCAEDEYISNKAKYPRNFILVQSLILN